MEAGTVNAGRRLNDIGSQRTKPNYWLLLSASLSAVVLIWQWRTLLATDIWTKSLLVPLIGVVLLLVAGALTWLLVKTVLFQRVVVSEAGVEFVDLLGNQRISVPFHNVKLIRFYESNQGRGGRFQVTSITIASQNRKAETKRFALLFLGTTQVSELKEYLLAQVSETWNSIVSVESTRLSNPNFIPTRFGEPGESPSGLTYWIYDILYLGTALLPLWFWR